MTTLGMIKIREVHLGKQTVTARDRDDQLLKDYLGGFGVNLRLAWDLIPAGVDPLAPENAFILGEAAINREALSRPVANPSMK